MMEFDNGYGVSVVRCKNSMGSPFAVDLFANEEYSTYTNNDNEWELAVLKNGAICYNTHITDDVMGYLLEEDVTRVMIQVQELI